MTLKQLKYVVEIAKHGSINKAAQMLYVTQPSISKTIKELEYELNIKIFYRNNKKNIEFTPEGNELLWYAKVFIEEFEAIENKVKKKFSCTKKIFISSQHYAFVIKNFIELINENISNNFEFILREKTTMGIINDISKQISSIGILFISDSEESFIKNYLKAKNIEFHLFKKYSPHVFIRKGHPLSKNSKIKLDDLNLYPVVLYEQEGFSSNFYEEAVQMKYYERKIKVLDRATMNNIISHTNAYNIGTGCIIDGIIEDNIISKPIQDKNIHEMNIGWIKLKNMELDPLSLEFIAKCNEFFNK